MVGTCLVAYPKPRNYSMEHDAKWFGTISTLVALRFGVPCVRVSLARRFFLFSVFETHGHIQKKPSYVCMYVCVCVLLKLIHVQKPTSPPYIN